MKKNPTTTIFLFSVLLLAFAACHKDNSKPTVKPNVLQITASDTVKALSLMQGQVINITLANPTDGGYSFDAWQYDNTVLKLDSHTRLPGNANQAGDAGRDAWQFTAIKSGTTVLKITASKGGSESINMFNDVVKIN